MKMATFLPVKRFGKASAAILQGWLLGCAGFGLLAYRAGAASMLPQLVDQPVWIWLVGPFFAALAGLGFKEFFCFQRPEAIGLTLLLPLLLLGWWWWCV